MEEFPHTSGHVVYMQAHTQTHIYTVSHVLSFPYCITHIL